MTFFNGEKRHTTDINSSSAVTSDENSSRTQGLQEDEAQELQPESIDRPPGPDDGLPPSKIYEPLSFPVITLLMPASVFGVLARLGLSALMNYPGHSIFPLAYAQAVGCLFMGLGLGMKEEIGQFYGPLYTALTTGFCGSLTTFSSWQLQVFQAWINASQTKRGGFADFLDGVALSTITLSLSVASVVFGCRIGSLIASRLAEPRLLPPMARYTLSTISILIYAATYIIYFLLPSSFRHQATAALLFSFPGTLTRYVLSTFLNRRIKALPLGTLTANTFGAALLAVFRILQSTPSARSTNACNVLQGLIDGYCGCLTTVSTFAAELRDFRLTKAVRYAVVSWVLGQLMMVLIYGIPLWSGRVEKNPTCNFG
ncbi:CrcB-like protein-domain-containing protein [Crepidotus variabilis]|uniref:CrcB-like protein-domain-containing protein n=1 Tax=Crepidotus variabilis TaxID=179855 RepID=A0A9P6EQL3_9AGAR|nr:CrcB-like protein-domain-containing protein [Crepidotus variabilis]